MAKKVGALILAGGSGSRFSSYQPKQYEKILNKTILQWTVEKFLYSPAIDLVRVVIGSNHLDLYNEALLAHSKLLPPVTGGGTRQNSSYLGLKSLQELDLDYVLIHDANRPLIEPIKIKDLVSTLSQVSQAAVAMLVPVCDSLLKLQGQEYQPVSRDHLYLVQTPQAFIYQKILEAHHCLNQRENFTDDISMLVDQVYYISGQASNIKLTLPADKSIIEAVLRAQNLISAQE